MTTPPPDDHEYAHFEEMTTMTDPVVRPEPLLDAAKGSIWRGALGSLVPALLAYGVIDTAQGDALADTAATGAVSPAAVAAAAAVVTWLTGLILSALAALRTALKARALVTPNEDPQADDGTPLVPERAVSRDPLDHTPEHARPDDYYGGGDSL